MTVWQEVRDLITERRVGALTDRVAALTEAERAEVARRLPEFLAETREAAERKARASWRANVEANYGAEDDWPSWMRSYEQASVRAAARDALVEFGVPLRIAGAGTISGPAAAVAWLVRREFSPRWASAPASAELVRVMTTRPAAWQADVAARLAGKIRTADDRVAPLALALLRACGAEPPKHDPLVLAWLSAGAVKDDPLTDTLLPRIFEAEGVGRALRDERLKPTPTLWFARIKRFLRTGKVSREEFLDGCVSRFLRGGDAVNLRFFVRLHELIDPLPQEAAARARDYLRLLPASPGPVAELALAQVRQGGPLDDADVAEAIGALTFRSEAKLARAGLSWLDEMIRRTPALADELAPALTTAFAHTSYEVQGRAARIALRNAKVFGADSAALVAEAVPLLPAALGAQVAAAFGGDTAARETPEPFVPVALPALTEPGPFPAPRLHPDDRHPRDWVECEQWLAAFVEQAGDDRAALRERLAPAFGEASPHLYEMKQWLDVSCWISALAKEMIASGTDPGVPDPAPLAHWARSNLPADVVNVLSGKAGGAGRERAESGSGLLAGIASMGLRLLFGDSATPDPAAEARRRHRPPKRRPASPPQGFLLHRLGELYVALREGALPPVLLATPTVMTGHLAPGVLVDRLEACAAAGVEPLAADLQQALLRLPRGQYPEAAERAARVGSRAASSAAAWLAGGGLPDPETGLRWGYVDGPNEHLFDEDEMEYVGAIRLVPVLRAEPTGHDLIDELLREPSRRRLEEHDFAMGWWSAILPSHREVVSVNYLPHLLQQWSHAGVHPSCLAALTEADGPVGEATALVLAYSLARQPAEAVPLLLRMAARGDLPAEAVGRQLALLIRRVRFEIRPVLASLSEAAHLGGHAQVWEILRSMLPLVLPGEGERPSVVHSEAVAFAADVAALTGARGEIPAVSAHAASGRRSRFTRECARLRDRLG
ncbi:DUF6493 family protein [Streptosporangium sp. NPDC051022]|uniref:DUF7824 domain-containing protein n=1 Tax=Streptosporangium sp. NPDC051022 TaxID=3155752 RepID=UPI00342EDEAC